MAAYFFIFVTSEERMRYDKRFIRRYIKFVAVDLYISLLLLTNLRSFCVKGNSTSLGLFSHS